MVEETALEWKTVRSAGYVGIVDQPSDGRLMRTARRFLRDTVEQFARVSTTYCDVVGEPPFTYSERQIHSTLFPAIARAADAVFVEHPVQRKQARAHRGRCRTQPGSDGSSHGWVDYWVLCRSTVFLVEVKHAFRGAAACGPTIRLNRPWNEAIGQIEAITDDEAFDLATEANRVAKVALMVIPAYAGSQSVERLEKVNRDAALERHMETCSSMEPHPDWSAVWSLHDRLQATYLVRNGSQELYPWVSFAAAIRVVGGG
jgi:hypothetical protein